MQLIHYLEEHNVLSSVQSGFRSGYGCVTAILNDITSALDAKQHRAAIFIDLTKVFVSVEHSILLNRLEALESSVTCWLDFLITSLIGCSM